MSFDFANKFGSMTFNDCVMRARLPKEIYHSLRLSIEQSLPLQAQVADVVAEVMKDWAIEKGATHFTHWFQPMTNITAGKHDSFINPEPDGSVVLEFSGKELAQGEPDASSFPSGGLRNTFEARGYTVWDCTSPAFIKDETLYIPTAFCSYTGEALDTKTPLLRSMESISKQALRILRLFGNSTSKHVTSTVGAEQEYFLIDREMYESRLDLKLAGRTLFGAPPAKGQELDDHYCGRIRLRVSKYMHELDRALWEVGITAKTKHNEVAPAQHELAPVFTSANIATDHNQLTMELMRTVAKKNNLACLLHEKPFDGVNGSGKHNNWSLSTDDGINLLNPGNTPYENVQFLIFLCAIIQCVDKYADLLRMSTASAGNDHRLGGNEAPPAIISIFLGEHLTNILENIANGHEQDTTSSGVLKMGVATLPQLPKDDSDRNRTSPFAFTGNKFEFRMVGSSASIAAANYIINTAVADILQEFSNRLETTKDFDGEIKAIITDTMQDHGKIIFNGNNYSEEWIQEAEKRGLYNLNNAVDAFKAINEPKNINLLSRHKVLSEAECHARYEIMLENYCKVLNIETTTMVEMVKKQILPAAIEYLGSLSATYNDLKKSDIDNKTISRLMQQVSDLIDNGHTACIRLETLTNEAHEISDVLAAAENYRDHLIPAMETLRNYIDTLETLVSDDYWPIPNYTDLLHHV